MDPRREELHLDIDKYLHNRRRMEPVKKEKGDISLDVYHDDDKKPGFFKRFFSMFKRKSKEEPEYEPEFTPSENPAEEYTQFDYGDHEEVPTPPERKGFLKRLMAIFVKEEAIVEELPETMEEVIDAKEDLRVLAKLFLKTLEKLPSDELKKFKETSEFKNFKDILRRHNVIK